MEPALEPPTVPAHVEDPVHPSRGALAMGLAALGLADDPRELADELAPVDGPAVARRALEALRRGAHAVLHGSAGGDEHLDAALEAGLLHHRGTPGVRELRAAVEAGRPTLILVQRDILHEDSPPGPHWVLATRRTDEGILLHDPMLEEGASTLAWPELREAFGHGDRLCSLELAKPPREHQV